MRDKEIETRLNRAITALTPDVLDGILAGCEQKGRVIPMRTNKNNRRFAAFAAVAAMLVLTVVGGLGWNQYRLYNTVDSVVALDVNPGIEIRVNEGERVLDAHAVNDDAVRILEGMDLRGTQLDVAVNAVIGSMLKNGCIDEWANSILITVESDDPTRGHALQERLTADVDGILSGHNIDGAILSQTLGGEDDAAALAEAYGITHGKAALILQLASDNVLHTPEKLAALSVNELNLLASSRGAVLQGVDSRGTPSDKAYIGHEAALETALQHAGVTESEITGLRTEMDWDDGRALYDLEFRAFGVEYEYEIDAVNGAVIGLDREVHDSGADRPAPSAPADAPYISAESAQDAALVHAGLTDADVTGLHCVLDYDDGSAHFDVEFFRGNTEYDYEIDAMTGRVLDFDLDYENDMTGRTPVPSADSTSKPAAASPRPTQQPDISSADIGRDRARDIALQHAGISASDAWELEVEYDHEKGRAVYEVDFESGGYEYSYEIDASTGEILRREKEKDDG